VSPPTPLDNVFRLWPPVPSGKPLTAAPDDREATTDTCSLDLPAIRSHDCPATLSESLRNRILDVDAHGRIDLRALRWLGDDHDAMAGFGGKRYGLDAQAKGPAYYFMVASAFSRSADP
jgi:hypothetical protein